MIVLASAANSGMRDRLVQDSQPAGSCLPVAPLVAKTSRSCSEQVGAVERVVGLGDGGHGGALVAGEVRWVFQQCPPAVLSAVAWSVLPSRRS